MGPGQRFYPAQDNCMSETRQRPLIPRNDMKKNMYGKDMMENVSVSSVFTNLNLITRAMSFDGAPPRYDPSGDREQWRMLE